MTCFATNLWQLHMYELSHFWAIKMKVYWRSSCAFQMFYFFSILWNYTIEHAKHLNFCCFCIFWWNPSKFSEISRKQVTNTSEVFLIYKGGGILMYNKKKLFIMFTHSWGPVLLENFASIYQQGEERYSCFGVFPTTAQSS